MSTQESSETAPFAISSLFDMNNICRTCLKNGEMQSLHDQIKYSEKDVTIASILTEFDIIQFSEGDGLPTKICIECTKEIQKCYLFFNKCKKSEEILQNQVKKYEQLKTKFNQESLDLQAKNEVANEHVMLTQSKDTNVLKEDIDVKDMDSKSENDYSSDEDNKEMKSESTEESELDRLELENNTKSKKKIRKKRKAKIKSPHECKRCSISFTTAEELLEHKKTVEHPKIKRSRRPCDICHKSVIQSRISQHMRTHTNEKPYICESCGASFSLGCNLRRHILSRHKNVRPYKCEYCQRAFTQLIVLQEHVRIHTGEKPYGCDYCTKSFAQASSYRKHLIVHAQRGEGPAKHNSILSGQKPFSCKVCDRVFKQRSHVKNHMRIHSGERPYSCSVCEKTFAFNGSLTVHMRTHTGETPYLCPTCGKGFHNSSSMKKHQQTHV